MTPYYASSAPRTPRGPCADQGPLFVSTTGPFSVSGKVCGAEVLLRWKHPEKGFIPPAEFIPVAEDTGQIVPIGEWVLRTACMQLAKWRRQGMAISPLAVNLSIRQLRQPDLALIIAGIIQETGLLDPIGNRRLTRLIRAAIGHVLPGRRTAKQLLNVIQT